MDSPRRRCGTDCPAFHALLAARAGRLFEIPGLMGAVAKPFRRSLPLTPHLSETSRARQFVQKSAQEAGFSDERCFDIQVACSEACANAIEHSPPSAEVRLDVVVHSNRLELLVEGRGQFELPAARTREGAHRGLGLPLMAKLSDHFALDAGFHGGTRATLTFYLPVSQDEGAQRPRFGDRRGRDRETLASRLSAVGGLGALQGPIAWRVLSVGAALQVALMIGVDQLGAPRRSLGIPGSAAALVGVVAATLAGPVVGVAVALVGGAAYFFFVSHQGSSVSWPAIVVSVLLWTLAAAAAGLAGDRVRRNARQREGLMSDMLAERDGLTESFGAANALLQGQNEELALREEELRVQTEEMSSQHDELQRAHSQTAGLLEEQRSLFGRLQDCLLDIPRQQSGVAFGHLYRSATEQAKVGGDFYDVFEVKGGRIALLVGDVSGHGLEAARAATLMKDTVRALSQQFRKPQLVLRETNRLLLQKDLVGFVSAFLCFLDVSNGTIRYASAGHPPPLLVLDGRVTRLEAAALPLGIFPEAIYSDTQAQIQEGSVLLLYTDGITEARRDGEFFGEERLAEALVALRHHPVDVLPSLLLLKALDFSRGVLRDDVALLAVSYLGKQPADLGYHGQPGE